MEISKFPEILGELSMRKQCVPGSFFSTESLGTRLVTCTTCTEDFSQLTLRWQCPPVPWNVQQDRLLWDGRRWRPHTGAEVFRCTVRREVYLTCKGVSSVLVVTCLNTPLLVTQLLVYPKIKTTHYQGDFFLGGRGM